MLAGKHFPSFQESSPLSLSRPVLVSSPTMHACHSSFPRQSQLSEGPADQGYLGQPTTLESPQLCPAMSHRDWHCPVCLQTATFPVQTNCGHLFCAPCLIAYWRHGSWLDAISCPLCRQKVSVICHLFSESRSDRQSKEVLGEITDYNKRYSGAPRRITDYLCDTPLFLQLLARGLGTMGGLVWLFFFRVALCCVGTMVSFSSPTLEPVSSPANTAIETDPSLCGLLGVLDDLVVVILLLNCVINIFQQMGPERGHAAQATAARGVLGNSL